MTHPLTNALAMRTAAAAVIDQANASGPYQAIAAASVILALPLEADHAALLREAVTMPEVAALIEAASEQAEYMSLIGDDGDLLRNLVATLQPFLALETP